MSYERDSNDDELARQLEQQMQTQPVGDPYKLDVGALPGGGGVGAATSPAGNPLGGANTGVAGGKDLGAPVPSVPAPSKTPGGAMARYGTGNIPGAENLGYGDTSSLRGFNTGEWGAGGTEGYEDSSIKNTFGKIATKYPSNPDGLRKLVNDPDFQRFFPDATILDHPTDPKIDFGDGNPVDVLFQTDKGWQWLPENEAGGGDMGGGGGLDMNSLIAGITGGGDPMGGIQSELEQLINGQDAESQSLIQRILAGEVQI